MSATVSSFRSVHGWIPVAVLWMVVANGGCLQPHSERERAF